MCEARLDKEEQPVMEEISCKVYSVIFNKDSYFILNTDAGRVKGCLLDVDSRSVVGVSYKFEGEWKTDKYGRIFEFYHAEADGDQLLFFLSRVVKGIGISLASEIIRHFGNDTEKIIEESPEKLLCIRGIGDKKLAKIINSWHKYKHLRLLAKFLNGYNITSNFITKIYNRFGDRSVTLIQENPYVLTQINGIGFLKADNIALRMGIDPKSVFRQAAAIEYILSEETNISGHCYIDIEVMKNELKELLGFDVNVTEVASQSKKFTIIDEKIGFSGLYKQEEFIYYWLTGNSNIETGKINDDYIKNYVTEYEKKHNIKFSDKQIESIYNACKYKVFALTGYAGTGKSSVASVFMDILNRHYNGRIVGCALSGIASRRLKQVSGFNTMTIHSLLGFDGDKFQYDENNPLDYDVIVVDECGMINTFLFYSLIKALRHDAVLILIGDDAQLPPIGAGNIFADIINKRLVKITRLDIVYRQDHGSVINIFAQSIRNGNVPHGYNNEYKDWVFENVSPNNYWTITKGGSNKDRQSLREEVNNNILIEIDATLRKIKPEINDMLYDLQVLVPQKKGVLGYEELNNYIQRIFNNPDDIDDNNKLERNGRWYCKGDKIIHIENKNKPCLKSYERYKESGIVERENIYETRVFNGTLGIIKDIDWENEIIICQMSTDDYVVYDFIEARDVFDLAYALTVHKAQGSEFRNVIIPLSLSNYIMLQNQWLYTAVTRAKSKVFLIGEEYAFKVACKNENKKHRNTWISFLSDDLSR